MKLNLVKDTVRKNIAVILAGGSGKRFGADRPKQLLPLSDGKSVLQHAVSAFAQCECISDVVVVMHADFIPEIRQSLNCTIVPGGKERWESSWNAIQAIRSLYPNEEVNILLHDAARPFVSQRIIQEVCSALDIHEAVTVAIPATDTMYQVAGESECRLVAIPQRNTMMRAQTPQAFRLTLIHNAYQLAVNDPHLQATDDCGIVYKYMPDTPIYIVEGDEANRKITFKEDL